MSGDLAGFSMFELFRAEAETHGAALSSGLLALEAHPDDRSQLESLMRAAHSIKGAARILGLDRIVTLAHAMEDCFVAAQHGAEQLTSARVDQLLEGVDFFDRIAHLTEADVPAWLESQAGAIDRLAAALRQPVTPAAPDGSESAGTKPAEPEAEQHTADGPTGSVAPVVTTESGSVHELAAAESSQPTVEQAAPAAPGAARIGSSRTPPGVAGEPVVSPVETADRQADQPPPETSLSAAAERQPPAAETRESGTAQPQPDADDRTVRVNAENLNQMMRLASEAMIESRRIQSVRGGLGAAEQTQRKVVALLENLAAISGQCPQAVAQLETMRTLGRNGQQLLQEYIGRLERVSWRSEELATALYHEVISSRMRPFAEGTRAFPRMIRDLARTLGKRVSLKVVGESVPVDRDILRDLEAPLNHLLRNCVDHGIETPAARRAAGKPETGRILLEARHFAGTLTVQVRDDGRGIDIEALREKIVARNLADPSLAAELSEPELLEFLFLPGFSTADQVTEVSGRGVGLDVVRTMVEQVSGTVYAASTPGHGTVFTLRLPVTLSVIRAALAEIGGQLYAFPLSQLVRVAHVLADQIRPVQGRQQFVLDGQSVGLVRAVDILSLPATTPDPVDVSVMVVGPDGQWCGLVVDRFVGEQDIVVRPLDPRLGKVPHIAAAAVTETGEPLLIVDVEDLLQATRRLLGEGRLRGISGGKTELDEPSRPRVLVVDDSITVREVQRHLLVNHGCDVDVAVDGQEGWHTLRAKRYDLLITDIDMPRMNGIELIERVRRDPHFAELPIVIVSYKERKEDRMRGMEAGANAYLTKGSFHDDSFIATVRDFLGGSR